MTVTFIANFMNHHQCPFSLKMLELTNGEYIFLSHTPLPDEQKKLGYEDMNNFPFVIRMYENQETYNIGIQKILEDDIVIFGSCDDKFIEMRKETGKPFIIYSERFFKKGLWRRFIPTTYRKVYNRMLKFQGEQMSVICSSAYLPYELKLLKANIPTYKWGYFPPVKKYDNIENIIKKKEPGSILWCGRLIKLKHPDMMIKTAKQLRDAGYSFQLNMIGCGPMERKLRKLIQKYRLQEHVQLLGAMAADKVRIYMEKAEIFAFTSDYREGWGAVLNESMNSACAVVASHSAGAVPYLIEEKINGCVFANGDIEALTQSLKWLLDNPDKRADLGRRAYDTIENTWNAKTAATRLYTLMEAIINKTMLPHYENGPCSVAPGINPRRKTK